jgi:DNA-binding NarL/FixJ family response regulator
MRDFPHLAAFLRAVRSGGITQSRLSAPQYPGSKALRDVVTDIVRHLRERAAAAARRRPSPAERLTAREREIIAAVAAGDSNREVAQRLSLAEDTVKHHISNIFDKLGVSNRAELAAYAASHGLAELPPPDGTPTR